MTVEEIIDYFNKKQIVQTSLDFTDDISEEDWDKYMFDANLVDDNISPDKHRWYQTSMTVFRIEDVYVGIRHIDTIFGEGITPEDCYHMLTFHKMERVVKYSYQVYPIK